MITKHQLKITASALILVAFFSNAIFAQKRKPIDAQATKETKALYANLWKLSKKHTTGKRSFW